MPANGPEEMKGQLAAKGCPPPSAARGADICAAFEIVCLKRQPREVFPKFGLDQAADWYADRVPGAKPPASPDQDKTPDQDGGEPKQAEEPQASPHDQPSPPAPSEDRPRGKNRRRKSRQ